MRILTKNVDLDVVGLIAASVFMVVSMVLIELFSIYIGSNLMSALCGAGVIVITAAILSVFSILADEQRSRQFAYN